MKPSLHVKDLEDDEFYPDPLSLTWEADGRLTRLPTEHTIVAGNVSKFWTCFYEHYQTLELDDVLLNANNWPYLGLAEPGDKLLWLEKVDLDRFLDHVKDNEV